MYTTDADEKMQGWSTSLKEKFAVPKDESQLLQKLYSMIQTGRFINQFNGDIKTIQIIFCEYSDKWVKFKYYKDNKITLYAELSEKIFNRSQKSFGHAS